MANGFSNYAEDLLLDWICNRQQLPTPPVGLQISLHSQDPGDNGLFEISGGGYARATAITDTSPSAQVNWNAKTALIEFQTIANKATISFPPASANWTLATHFGVWDASGANLLYTGAITGGVTVASGQTLSLKDGNLGLWVD